MIVGSTYLKINFSNLTKVHMENSTKAQDWPNLSKYQKANAILAERPKTSRFHGRFNND
jgi:hypothetical protein